MPLSDAKQREIFQASLVTIQKSIDDLKASCSAAANLAATPIGMGAAHRAARPVRQLAERVLVAAYMVESIIPAVDTDE